MAYVCLAAEFSPHDGLHGSMSCARRYRKPFPAREAIALSRLELCGNSRTAGTGQKGSPPYGLSQQEVPAQEPRGDQSTAGTGHSPAASAQTELQPPPPCTQWISPLPCVAGSAPPQGQGKLHKREHFQLAEELDLGCGNCRMGGTSSPRTEAPDTVSVIADRHKKPTYIQSQAMQDFLRLLMRSPDTL